MTEKEIDILLKKGEGLTIEFKSSFNNEVIETLVAFANTAGGSVLIGISNDKKMVGVTINSESVQNWLNEIKSKTSPALMPYVDSVNHSDKVLVVFTMHEYPVKPVSTKCKNLFTEQNSRPSTRLSLTPWDF